MWLCYCTYNLLLFSYGQLKHLGEKKSICDLYPIACSHPIYSSTQPSFVQTLLGIPCVPTSFSAGCELPRKRDGTPKPSLPAAQHSRWPATGTHSSLPSVLPHAQQLHPLSYSSIPPGKWCTSPSTQVSSDRHPIAGALPPYARPALLFGRKESHRINWHWWILLHRSRTVWCVIRCMIQSYVTF